jgi:hypothetical protein
MLSTAEAWLARSSYAPDWLPPDGLRLLQSVTDTALAHLGIDEQVHELLERLRRWLAVDTVAILLVSPDGQKLTISSASGPDLAGDPSRPVHANTGAPD